MRDAGDCCYCSYLCCCSSHHGQVRSRVDRQFPSQSGFVRQGHDGKTFAVGIIVAMERRFVVVVPVGRLSDSPCLLITLFRNGGVSVTDRLSH